MAARNGDEPTRLAVIVGSTREGRAVDRFLPWLVERARRHGRFAVDVLDLAEWRLPGFGPGAAGAAGAARVGRFNERVGAAGAYLFVTPEYNHSVPGALKNAVDQVGGGRFRNKPAGFVGYSVGLVGGARAAGELPPARQRRTMPPAA